MTGDTNEESTGGGRRGHEWVVRSEIDSGGPGLRYDEKEDAIEKRDKLNDEDGLPNDHRIEREIEV